MTSLERDMTETPATGVSVEQVYAAIADVLDPELDEPLVQLGFVDQVLIAETVQGSAVTLIFKLPTYWCAPNFAYLMASDLRACVRQLAGVSSVSVQLQDHFADDEINQGLAQGRSFREAFPEGVDGDDDLEELRRTFLRKGFLMRQDTLLRQLLKAGLAEREICALRLADITVDEASDHVGVLVGARSLVLSGAAKNAGLYLLKRHTLHLPQEPDALLITDEHGEGIVEGGLREFLRRSRSVRINIMFNTSLCKGLFLTRYKDAGANEAHVQ